MGSKITADGDCIHEIKRRLPLGRKAMCDQPRQLKSRDITLLTKVPLFQTIVFSSSHVWMWVLDYKQRWVLKNLCFWTVVLEKTLESPLDCKEIKPVNPSQSCIFIERTDAEAPILWPPDVKNWLIGKDPDDAKDWRQEDQEMTEGEMVGCHHWLNRHEFEQAPWVGDARGKSGVLQLQRVGHDWGTELNWSDLVVQSLSCFWLSATSRTLARQAPLPEFAQSQVHWINDTI